MMNRWRSVRVFVSSTFRDMHAERDHLVKVVFPALRERLEPHRVHLIDIDLRWGLTREQAENDQVLDLCLRQIDECRPFFMGILGERYGRLSGLEKFGERVGAQLWEAIRQELSLTDMSREAPQEAVVDSLAEERDYHDRFVEARLRVYVGRDSVQQQLIDYAQSDDTRLLLVTGLSGSGKSAVLAKMCEALAAKVSVVSHFVGASPASTNIRRVLPRSPPRARWCIRRCWFKEVEPLTSRTKRSTCADRHFPWLPQRRRRRTARTAASARANRHEDSAIDRDRAPAPPPGPSSRSRLPR